MNLAIKFNSNGNYESHCTDGTIIDLKEIHPDSEGFGFYDIKDAIYENIQYSKLVGNEVVIDEAQKSADIVKTETVLKISELKAKLNTTDYQAIKFAEGQITAEEYGKIKGERQAWRDEINKLMARLQQTTLI